jgi:hypothetical protein
MIYTIARLNILGILPVESLTSRALGSNDDGVERSLLMEKTERSDTTNLQYFRRRRINIQFPDKAGFTLRYNPASGISAALRPAKLVRLGFSTPTS